MATTQIVSAEEGASRRGITDDTVKLGALLGLSGRAAVLGKNLGAALEAYFAWVNDTGGIHGRKIQLLIEDNGWEPSIALGAAKKLISQDNVLAFVNSFGTAPTHGLFNFIESEKVPTLPYSYSRTMVDPLKRYLFNFLASYYSQGIGGVNFVYSNFKNKSPKIGLITVEGDAGDDIIAGAKAAAENHGFKLAAVQQFPQNAVDYSSQVLNLKRANVDFVFFAGSPTQNATILNEIEKLGWNPKYIMNDPAYSPKLLKLAPTVNGAYWIKVMYDYNEDISSIQNVRKLTEKYSDFKPTAVAYLVGWTCAEIMTAGLKKAGRDLTLESFMKSLESLKDEPMSAIGPVTFSPTSHSAGDTYRIVQIDPNEKSGFKSILDWQKASSE